MLAELIADAAVEPVLAGETGANVVRITSRDASIRYLKYGTGRVAGDIADEALRLRWLHGRLPCPRVQHHVQDAAAAWLMTTGIAGRTGDDWLAESEERLPMVIDAFAGFLRQLHALPVADCPFDAAAAVRMTAARRNIDAGLVDVEDFDDDHKGWTAEQLWDQLITLTPAESERAVTHGDFSLGNLLLDADGAVTGVIDVGRLGIADPYQDIAILWQNLSEFGTATQQRFLSAYGIDRPDMKRLTFHRCLDELF